MKKSDLYREWARVLDMCEGTNVDPGKCVKVDDMPILTTPNFDARGDRYSFAVAILENKPVFVGDRVWYSFLNIFVEIKNATQIMLLIRDGQASWQPLKKTFALNGEELPCPGLSCDHNTSRYLTIRGVNEIQFTFHNKDDRDKVANALIKLLKDATK